uniref:SWIM zinc finger family protein n=1 Tax=Hymenobacter sp. TaxID=1898978 RepID=UPI00286BB564
MFTRQTLRRLANANSFARGEDYYDEGNLSKLRREGDTFLATVRGSRAYRVGLRLAGAGPEFTCNCPYDFDGICKHCVALGLAVLDGYLPTDLVP